MEDDEELVPEVKKEVIKELLTKELKDHQMPEAFFSYSGGIMKNPVTGRFQTTSYEYRGEHGLITGGKARVIATAEIAKDFPDLKIVANSHYYADEPSHASVIAGELIKRGVESERILLEEESMSTITQLVETVKMVVQEDWHRVAVITNDYHLPRMKEMYRQLGDLIDETDFQKAFRDFKEQGREIGFVSAEEILCFVSGHFKYLIGQVKNTSAYQDTVMAEARGLRDLQEGKYKVAKTTKEKPEGK